MPEVTFDATTSTGDITVYNWDFGDSTTGTGAIVVHTYSGISGQQFTYTLTVSGPSGTSTVSGIYEIDVITGSASGSPQTSATMQAEDPQVMLRISNDAGKTWISEQWRSAGKLGEWAKRIRWNRLGSARRRVFEVVVTDPVPWRLVGADLEIAQGKPFGKL